MTTGKQKKSRKCLCPECKSKGRLMKNESFGDILKYRCCKCHHVWYVIPELDEIAGVMPPTNGPVYIPIGPVRKPLDPLKKSRYLKKMRTIRKLSLKKVKQVRSLNYSNYVGPKGI